MNPQKKSKDKFTQVEKIFIRLVLITTGIGTLSILFFQYGKYQNGSTTKSDPQNNKSLSQNGYFSIAANEEIPIDEIQPILKNYECYLARHIDSNELVSLINVMKKSGTVEGKVRNLKNSISLAKFLSTHKLTGLITGDKPLALIDGKAYRLGEKIADCVLVNITSNYVTLQQEDVQFNLRMLKNHPQVKSPPKSYLARYPNSHEIEYGFSNINNSPITDSISSNLSMNYSDVNLDNNTLVDIDSIIWETSTIPEVETVFYDDTINLSNKNINGKYLGQLGGNEFNFSSTRNPFGAGNPFHPDSISNQFGKYGSEFSPNSVRNPYAINTPKLYDSQGNYRGKLSSNPYDPDSISNPFGRYGNPFSPDSINNSFGAGNPFSPDSPRNPFGKGLAIYGEN